MNSLCATLLLFQHLSSSVPVGAKFCFSTNNLNVLEKYNMVTVLKYWKTGLKLLKEYDDFVRLERIE